jgi:predicted  nucleic acid-binding Zn-ribbon protein
MSNADPEEVRVTVERHGVSVEKSFEPNDFPVPAIAFVVRSTRSEPVEVRLTDVVPDTVDPEDIGFHPKYGADFWHNEDGQLVFEREFEAGEEFTTVYGLRASDMDEVGRFLGEPELDEVRPELDDAAGQVVEDVMNEGDTLNLRDPNSVAGGASDDDLEAAIAAADVETVAEEDPTSDSERSTEASEPEPVASDTTGNASVSLEETDVVEAFVAAVREGKIDEDDMETLRAAIGVADTGSVDARITHLQSELADLKAYTTALEEFLDENGDTQQLLADLNSSIEALETGLERVDDEVSTAADTAEGAVEAVDEVETAVTELRSEVQSLDDRFENVSGDVADVRNDVQANSSGLDSVRESVDEVERDVAAVREEIPDGELEGLDERVAALDDRIVDIEEEIQGLSEMRQQMASVFGGAAAEQVDD